MTILSHAYSRWTILSLGVVLLLAGCDAMRPSLKEAEPERRILVFWDVSESITEAERAQWTSNLHARANNLGNALWEETEYDEIVVLPVHRYTVTSTPLVRQRFSGGVYGHHDNGRRLQRNEFSRQLRALDSLQFGPATQNASDLLGSISLIQEYVGGDTSRIREILYYSDMLEATQYLNFEARISPFATPQGELARCVAAARGGTDRSQRQATHPEELARCVAEDKQWSPGLLTGVTVRVRLPGTIEGAMGVVLDERRLTDVEVFWRTLFDLLGTSLTEWRRM